MRSSFHRSIVNLLIVSSVIFGFCVNESISHGLSKCFITKSMSTKFLFSFLDV